MTKKPVGVGAFIKREGENDFTVTLAFHHLVSRDEAEKLGMWLADVVVPRLGEIGMNPIEHGKPN